MNITTESTDAINTEDLAFAWKCVFSIFTENDDPAYVAENYWYQDNIMENLEGEKVMTVTDEEYSMIHPLIETIHELAGEIELSNLPNCTLGQLNLRFKLERDLTIKSFDEPPKLKI